MELTDTTWRDTTMTDENHELPDILDWTDDEADS